MVRAKGRKKRRVGRGPCHRRKLSEVQQGLQTRKRRGNRWHMRLQGKRNWDLAKRCEGSTGIEFSRWSIEVVNSHSGPVLVKNLKIVRGERESTQARARGGGRQPTRLARTVEGPRRSRPCERMRKTRSSSNRVRLLGPLRSSSVAGKGRRERKSAF